MTEIVCPGKRLGRVNEYRAGPGTYVRGAYIYASVLGPKEEQQADPGGDDKPFVMVSGDDLCLYFVSPLRVRPMDLIMLGCQSHLMQRHQSS